MDKQVIYPAGMDDDDDDGLCFKTICIKAAKACGVVYNN